MLLDQGAQGIVPGVELREPGVLAPWPPADFVYSCLILHAPSKNCRHRGSDARDAPLLLEADALAGEGDVVIGGEQGDQTEDKAADSLVEAEAVEAEAPEALILG